jgi:hypothetical protein
MQYPSATPGISQHNTPGQTDPLQKQNKTEQQTMELKPSAQQRGQGLLKAHQRKGEEQGAELVQTISKKTAGQLTVGR